MMGFWDYFWGTLRDYHRDPFPHALLRTREKRSPHDFETQESCGSQVWEFVFAYRASAHKHH